MSSRAAQVESETPGPRPSSPVPTASYPLALPEGPVPGAIKRKDKTWGSGKVRPRIKGHRGWGGAKRNRPGCQLRVEKVTA